MKWAVFTFVRASPIFHANNHERKNNKKKNSVRTEDPSFYAFSLKLRSLKSFNLEQSANRPREKKNPRWKQIP